MAKPVEVAKSTTVLKLKRAGTKAAHYQLEAAEGEALGVVKDLYTPISHFELLGSPEYITVTVEPGDRLNGG